MSILKRSIVLIVVLVILVSCYTVPVSAAATSNAQDNYIEVLDYSTLNDSGSNVIWASEWGRQVNFSYQLPREMRINYLEICFVSSTGLNAEYSQIVNGVAFEDFQRLGIPYVGSYHRVSVELNQLTDTLDFQFILGHYGQYIEVVSIKAYGFTIESFQEPASATVTCTTHNGDFSYSFSMADASTNVTQTLPRYNGGTIDVAVNYSYYLKIDLPNWKSYDYVDIVFGGLVSNINSIVPIFGDTVLDHEITWLKGSSEPVYEYNMQQNYEFTCIIRVFLDGLKRTSDLEPKVVIDGSYVVDSNRTLTGYFDLYGYSGYVAGRVESSLWEWIKAQTASINAHIDAGIAELKDQLASLFAQNTTASDHFQDEVDQQTQELDDMSSVMDSVTQPAIDSINVNMDQYVDQADITSLTAPLSALWTGNIMGTMVLMSIMLATVSYVLFGKR